MSEAEEILLATRSMYKTSANKGSQIVDAHDDLEAPSHLFPYHNQIRFLLPC